MSLLASQQNCIRLNLVTDTESTRLSVAEVEVEAGDMDKAHGTKRRPRSYKTNKSSSYTEQIRALIDYQMSLVKQATGGENEQKGKEEKEAIEEKGGMEEMEEGELAGSLDSDESGRHRNKNQRKEENVKKSHSRQHRHSARDSLGPHKSWRQHRAQETKKYRP